MFNANFGQVLEQSQMQRQGNQQQHKGMIMQQQLPQMGAGSFPEGVLNPQHQQQKQQHVMPQFDRNLQNITGTLDWKRFDKVSKKVILN